MDGGKGKTMTMDQKQLNYCKAKALVELLKEDRDRHMTKNAMGDTDVSIDAYYDELTRYEAKIGYWDAVRALRDAEDYVIHWAKDVMISEYPKRWNEIKPVFDKAPGDIMLREKLIDICMRLSA